MGNSIGLTLGHALGILYEAEEIVSIEEEFIVNMITLKGWDINSLYESVLYESEGGWTNVIEDEKSRASYNQEMHYQAAHSRTLNTSNWKYPILEGRTITVFDPTGETTNITIDNPEVSDLHLATF